MNNKKDYHNCIVCGKLITIKHFKTCNQACWLKHQHSLMKKVIK